MATMGMDKSGDYAIPSASTWTTIPSLWTARAGYPATTITSGHILALPSTENVCARVWAQWTASSDIREVRIMRNDVFPEVGPVPTYSLSGGLDNICSNGMSFPVTAGDNLRLQGFSPSGTVGGRTLLGGADQTYVYYYKYTQSISCGMTKVGTQPTIPQGVWTDVSSLTNRSGYPFTSISFDVMQITAKATGTLAFRGTFIDDSASEQLFRVLVNGVPFGTPAPAGSMIEFPNQFFPVGTTIKLQAYSNSTVVTERNVRGDTNATWCEFNANIDEQGNVKAVPVDIGWDIDGGIQHNKALAAQPVDIGWDIQGQVHLQGEYFAEVQPNIGWDIQGVISHFPYGDTPLFLDLNPDVSVSIHTPDGRSVGDLPCDTVINTSWTRELNEVSTCTASVVSLPNLETLQDTWPLHHWLTVWENDRPAWSGVLMHMNRGAEVTELRARDAGMLMWKTLIPFTRTFLDTVPSNVADILWRAMLEHHGVAVSPLVIASTVNHSFTRRTTSDSRYLHQEMSELVGIGLNWTVVAGRPVLGTFPSTPTAEFQECDFLVSLSYIRDGGACANDVLVQGQNFTQRVKVPIGDLRMQSLVSLDDMSGVSNIQQAAQEYARNSAYIRDTIEIPSDATLTSQAPVSIDMLVPGRAFLVHTDTVSQLMRLDKVTVTRNNDNYTVQVTLVAQPTITELGIAAGGTA